MHQSVTESNADRGSRLIRRTAYIAIFIGLTAMVVVVLGRGVHEVFQALLLGGWQLGFLVPLHALPLLPDAGSWRTLINGPRPILRLYWIAWIRQAVGRLMPVAGIGGELVGIRLLMHGAVQPAQAVASVVVEVFTTLVGQFLFVIVGLICALQLTGAKSFEKGVLLALAACVPAMALLLILLRRGLIFGRLHRIALGLIGREPKLASFETSDAIDVVIIGLCSDPRRLTLATALQLLGMLLGCLEIWAAFNILGGEVSLLNAVIVESLNQTAKHVIFFIPGALGVQELTFMAISPLIGVSLDVALAASLAKRAVDVVVGVPALISWQWVEGRRWAAKPTR
jgi:putative membrane protein